MSYADDAEQTSNVSVVDVWILEELAYALEMGKKITPENVINLARLIEAFILNNEIVIKSDDGCTFDGDDIIRNYEFEFTQNWLQTFFDNNVICDTSLKNANYKSASKLFELENIKFHKLELREKENKIADIRNEYQKALFYNCIEDDLNQYENDKIEYFWNNITKYYGVPYISTNLKEYKENSSRYTNLSIYLYEKMKKHFQYKFTEIEKIIGPRYVNIPPFLKMVLQECRDFEDIPKITMQIRDRYSNFIMDVTEREYQLKKATCYAEQSKIMDEIENCYNSIVAYKEKPKKHILTRLCGLAQNTIDKSKAIEKWGEDKLENEMMFRIPDYYNMWTATEEAGNSFPLLQKVFGNQIDDEFLIKLNKMYI